MGFLPELTKGQIYQATISASLFLIYILTLGIGLVTGKIDTAWIMDRILALGFIGVSLIIIFPTYRASDHLLDKIMKQVGVWSFTLLVMTWFIYIVQMLGIVQPQGYIETTVFMFAERLSFFTLFPLIAVLLFGKDDFAKFIKNSKGTE